MKSALLCISTSAIALLLVTAAYSQEETFVPANDVSFTVTTDRSTYTAGEQIYLKYEIANISNAPVYVPREWDAQCPATPHIWAWFESGSGKHFVPGYGGSYVRSPQTVTARMQKEAILLKPGQRLKGTLRMDTTLFGGLKTGAYRLEATLTGYKERDFTPAQQSELAKMGAAFVSGEVPASTRITLTP